MQNLDKPQPVKFRFRNVGPVEDAALELGDLTVIAGRNNTGKTYIVYSLYGFLKMWRGWPYADEFMMNQSQAQLPDMRSLIEGVIREGRAEIPLDGETLEQQRRVVIQAVASAFSKEGLPAVFSSQGDDFEGSSVEIELAGGVRDDVRSVKSDLFGGGSLSIEYDGSKVVIAVENVKDQRRPHLRYDIAYHYFLFLLENHFPEPFILSAERFGISLFYRELDFTKNQLVDLLQKLGDDKSRERVSPFSLMDKATSRYALPIKDNIDYTRSIPDLRGARSEIYEDKLFDNIKNMMDGYYGNSGSDIRFISKSRKKRSFNIPLHLASSSVRGLSDLYFFLRHVAKRNHLLIIDEPESHLDTANQILLARLLARFVNAGLKVLITTHSDYLIKEINNLIMLSRPFADKDAVIRKLKYGADDFLDPDSIRAYVAEGNGLNRCEVDGFGVDMPVFDKTIDEINRVANELSSRLPQDSEA